MEQDIEQWLRDYIETTVYSDLVSAFDRMVAEDVSFHSDFAKKVVFDTILEVLKHAEAIAAEFDE